MTKKNEIILRIILIVVLILIAIAISIAYKATLRKERMENANLNIDNNFEEDYLRQNCECIQRNNFACQFEGFAYDNGYCRKNNTIVNPIRKCSKYDCDGELVEIKQEDVPK